jgi:Cytochrome P460
MGKQWVLVLVLVAAVALGAVWVSAAGEKGPGEFKADYKTSGEFFTLMDGMVMGKSPHGKVQIWYSNDLKDLLPKGKFTAPVGAVSIKPYENDKGKGIAVMVKKEPGYDAANGDWYYEMRMADGKPMMKGPMPMAGKMAMCIGCHAAASGSDYLAGIGMR